MDIPFPKRLNRSGIKQAFPRVREATWDNMFDNDKANGLYKCRVPGPDKGVYYDVEQIMLWLMERNRYRRSDFTQPGELFYEGPLLRVSRVHALI